MVKKILSKIKQLEQKKQLKLTSISKLQGEIDEIDVKLKKLYLFKKNYEKLEENSKELIENLWVM